ncbi:hypothetical protein F0562_007736 [Nyssa sinensis]|uniref:Glycosyltransferase n=1 Tax=Nyssa sinensis TaxID=561372 RepID=A0A5J5A7I2_9ASTE|nr:hypothetical protein F0562_007736 [Nyssa sinensis]
MINYVLRGRKEVRTKMNETEIVFIPSPGVGHLLSTVEMAKLLINRDERLSITVLIMKLPNDSTPTSSASASAYGSDTSRIRFVHLPTPTQVDSEPPKSVMHFVCDFIHSHKTHVRDVVADITRSHSVRLAGVVIDMFCTTMIDVANEFGVPSFVFFTSGAAVLGLMFHLQSLQDNQDINEFHDSDAELLVPTFTNPVPAKLLPSVVLDKGGSCTLFLAIARKFRETKGILVNTFAELESHAIKSLSTLSSDGDDNIPPIYPVGPILNIKEGGGGGEVTHNNQEQYDAIMSWLDGQPPSSVVFLCFGSMGSFGDNQVKEIAHALESSGHRFLWSLRRPPPKGSMDLPHDYSNPEDVLPEGFLERTVGKGMGKVIGWAPQAAVLSHPAVGGFVSHCGWNSTLESIWCGVPVATWPLYAEQQMNAFELVRELGLAVELKLDYRRDSFWSSDEVGLLTAEEIESGIRQVMIDGEIRKKVKEMKEKSRVAMMEGGSSYIPWDLMDVGYCLLR